MKLPYGDHAVVDIRKVRDHLLYRQHQQTQAFADTLDIGREEEAELQDALLNAARNGDAIPRGASKHGALYRIEFHLSHGDKSALIRSEWIIIVADKVPHLLTAFVMKKRGDK